MKHVLGHVTNDLDGSRAVRHIGDFQSLRAAIAAAQTLVSNFLLSQRRPGMAAAHLFSVYKATNAMPVIFSDADFTISDGSCNHLEYASIRCAELCEVS